MTSAYREGTQAIVRNIGLRRLRLAVLERRLAPDLDALPMELRGELELAKERAQSQVDDCSAETVLKLVIAYDNVLDAALAFAAQARSKRRLKGVAAAVFGVVAVSLVWLGSAVAEKPSANRFCENQPDCWHKGWCSKVGDRCVAD